MRILFIDNELVVAPLDHPLAGARNITLERLCEERFLMREPGSETRLVVERLFNEQNTSVTPYMELGNSETIKQGVMAGLGVSVLSRHSLRLELAAEHIVLLDVDGFPLKRRWYAVQLKSSKLTLVAQSFLDFMRDQSTGILAT